MSGGPIHMMKATTERSQFTTRCGATVAKARVTVWETDITCPNCVLPAAAEEDQR